MPIDMEFNFQDQIRRYLGLLRERWFLITVCVIICMLIGFGLAQLWPSSYESSTLFVLREAKLIDESSLEKATISVQLAAKHQTLSNELRSHSRMESVLKKLEWKEFIKAQMDPLDMSNFYAKVRKAVNIELSPAALGELQVKFYFTWNDPFKAAAYCKEMRDNWIDAHLDNYKRDYISQLDKAELVLRERTEEYTRAQQELEKFDNETQYASLGTLEENNRLKTQLITSISKNRSMVQSLEGQIADLENELSILPQKIQQEGKTVNPAYQAALDKWTKAAAMYQLKENRLTDANPSLVQAREAMESAKASLDEMESMKYKVEGVSEIYNPEYQNKSKVLTELKPEYAMAKAELINNEKQLAEVEEKIQKLPGVMAERDYILGEIDLAKEVYQKTTTDIIPIRNRVNSFKTIRKTGNAYQAEATFRNQTFEILEEAIAATTPKNPMALIIMVAFTMAGLGLGLILALAGELLKSSFSTQEEVT
ncbi:MAG: Wzz/FepE/Etk N-terminal domain-containing protein, partial [Planctomycetota bacterium]